MAIPVIYPKNVPANVAAGTAYNSGIAKQYAPQSNAPHSNEIWRGGDYYQTGLQYGSDYGLFSPNAWTGPKITQNTGQAQWGTDPRSFGKQGTYGQGVQQQQEINQGGNQIGTRGILDRPFVQTASGAVLPGPAGQSQLAGLYAQGVAGLAAPQLSRIDDGSKNIEPGRAVNLAREEANAANAAHLNMLQRALDVGTTGQNNVRSLYAQNLQDVEKLGKQESSRLAEGFKQQNASDSQMIANRGLWNSTTAANASRANRQDFNDQMQGLAERVALARMAQREGLASTEMTNYGYLGDKLSGFNYATTGGPQAGIAPKQSGGILGSIGSSLLGSVTGGIGGALSSGIGGAISGLFGKK